MFWQFVDATPQGLKPVSYGPFRHNSHPIDEGLSMGTPVKSCPDTKRRF